MKQEITEKQAVGYARSVIFWMFLLCFLALFLVFIFFKYCTHFEMGNYSIAESGQFGDTFNGVLGPIIAIAAAVLTFLAFYIQYLANEQQKKQFNDQAHDFKIERFESKFFELLKIHREIVSDITVGKHTKGLKSFIKLFYEFRFTYYSIKDCLFIQEMCPMDDVRLAGYDDEATLLKITFTIFFLGIGPNSDALVKDYLRGIYANDINDTIIRHLASIINQNVSKYPHTFKFKVKQDTGPELEFDYKASYKPFQGHQGKLGHYYRHLYQIVKFVEDANLENNEKDWKYKYVKMLRSQLSVYEQMLIYYNSFTRFGRAWFEKEYMSKYKLIKNVPIPLMIGLGEIPEVRLENQIKKYFGTKEKYFEWYNDINNR